MEVGSSHAAWLTTASDAWPADAIACSPHGVALIDADGRVHRTNAALEAALAPPGGTVVGRLWADLVAPGARPALGAALTEVARTGRGQARFEAHHRPDGRADVWLVAEVRGLGADRPAGAPTAVVHFTDVTAEHRRRAELLESERRIQTLFGNLPGLAYRCRNDRRWTMEFMSDGVLDLLGFRPEEFFDPEGLSLTDLIHPEDIEAVWEQIQAALAERQRFHLAYRLRTRLGQLKWVWEQGEGVYDEADRLVALEGYIIDITEERLAREALRESRENLSIVLESIGDAVLAADALGRVALINPVAEELTGWGRDDALGRPLGEIARLVDEQGRPLPIGDAPELAERAARGHAKLVDRAGRHHTVSYTAAPMRDRERAPAGLVLVAHDVTEQIVAEERLRHGQQMEAIGRLAGGVAHDFNNLLAGIMGYADLLRLELIDHDPLDQYVQVILETSRRGAELTQQLLAFSRRQQFARVQLDLHSVIADAIALLRRTVDPRVVIRDQLEAPVSTVSGDRTALQNALLNIGLNARDAMPSGGVLSFTTRATDLDAAAGALLVPPIAPGPYLEVTITDTGPGLARENLERIFQPFFTSKPVGRGTGLGLAAVYGTITGHGGSVRAANAAEGGAEFTLLLPLSPHAASGEHRHAEGAPILGAGRVLVADDEAFVRNLLDRMLTSLGYSVETAADGAEAVARFASDPASWELVILDTLMPNLSGPQALARMVALRPDVRVLIASGHRAAPMDAPQVRGYIQKPFDLVELSQSVADARRG